MRTVNEMTWAQRCAADAQARDRAMAYGRSEFYNSDKWGQLTAIADGTTTLTDVADALAAGTATPYQQALAASYWVDAAEYLAVRARGEVAHARRGHPHEGLTDDLGQVPWLVDDDEQAAAEQRQAAADDALVEARQIWDAAMEQEQDHRRQWEQAASEQAYHEAGAQAGLAAALARSWRTAVDVEYDQICADYGNDGHPVEDRHISAQDKAAQAAAVAAIAERTGLPTGAVWDAVRDVSDRYARDHTDTATLDQPDWDTVRDNWDQKIAERQEHRDGVARAEAAAAVAELDDREAPGEHQRILGEDAAAVHSESAAYRAATVDHPDEGLRLYAQMLLEQARREVDAGIEVGRVADAEGLLAEIADAIAASPGEDGDASSQRADAFLGTELGFWSARTLDPDPLTAEHARCVAHALAEDRRVRPSHYDDHSARADSGRDPVLWGSVATELLDDLDQARARLESGDVHGEDSHALAEHIEHLEDQVVAEQAAGEPVGNPDEATIHPAFDAVAPSRLVGSDQTDREYGAEVDSTADGAGAATAGDDHSAAGDGDGPVLTAAQWLGALTAHEAAREASREAQAAASSAELGELCYAPGGEPPGQASAAEAVVAAHEAVRAQTRRVVQGLAEGERTSPVPAGEAARRPEAFEQVPTVERGA